MSDFDVTPSGALDNAEALSNIHPIPNKKTLMLVNAFIINTVDFMNKFAALCERKIAKVSTHTQKLEVMLGLLEAKLESVPWLDSMQAGADAVQAPAPATTTVAAAPAPTPSDAGIPPPPPGLVPGAAAASAPAAAAPAAAPAAPEPAPAPAPAADVILLREDSRFSKFFKMLSYNIPKQSVQHKMTSEGLDPSILDMDPEGPAPPGATRA
jgi:hypothetical protein